MATTSSHAPKRTVPSAKQGSANETQLMTVFDALRGAAAELHTQLVLEFGDMSTSKINSGGVMVLSSKHRKDTEVLMSNNWHFQIGSEFPNFWPSDAIEKVAREKSIPRVLLDLEPKERVLVVKHGFPAGSISELANFMHISEVSTKNILGLADSTISRKAKEGKPLAQDQSERFLGMMRLIGLVEEIVLEYGDEDAASEFSAAKWLGEWIERPQPSLGMHKPSEYLDTATGLTMIETLLKRIAVGAFA